MTNLHKNSSKRYVLTGQAQRGEHWGARFASQTPRKYKKGDSVRVIKTGVETTVADIASWGDYVLDGINGYFTARQLEPR